MVLRSCSELHQGSSSYQNRLFYFVFICVTLVPIVQTNAALYTVNVRGGVSFTIPQRYQRLKRIGPNSEGYLGAVTCIARDSETNKDVEIRKFVKPFETQAHAWILYRDLVISQLVHHKNVLRITDKFTPQGSLESFQDVYLVTERMAGNLGHVTMKGMDHSILSRIIYQILCGVHYLQTAGVYRRDLRPSFIGVNRDYSMKILNYGIPRVLPKGYTAPPGEDSFHYQALEAILGGPLSDPGKTDVWSVGCMMGELILSTGLFRGEDHVDQVQKIFMRLGTPPEEFMDRLLTASTRMFLHNLPHYAGSTFDQIFPDHVFPAADRDNANLNAVEARDLLSRMLVMDPSRRIGEEDAMHHPYLSLWYDEADLQPAPKVYIPQDVEFERSTEEWKNVIFNEVSKY